MRQPHGDFDKLPAPAAVLQHYPREDGGAGHQTSNHPHLWWPGDPFRQDYERWTHPEQIKDPMRKIAASSHGGPIDDDDEEANEKDGFGQLEDHTASGEVQVA